MKPLAFSKMHGAGNDFVVLDLRDSDVPSPALCRLLADRRRGVGCDLILGVEAPRSPTAVAAYRIWTADGLPSSQCGNGARCIAAWVMRAGLAPGPAFTLDSPSGSHRVAFGSDDAIRIDMGRPCFDHDALPVTGLPPEQALLSIDLGDGLHLSVSPVAIGNPHAVIEVDDVDAAPVALVGLALQASPHFPKTVNVGFVEVCARDHIRLRVFEFGAGETLACGSGACAAAASLMQRGLIDRGVRVSLRGGDLRIDWPDSQASIALTGPARFVFDGVFTDDRTADGLLARLSPMPRFPGIHS